MMPNHRPYRTPLVTFADWVVFYAFAHSLMRVGEACGYGALKFVDALGYHVSRLGARSRVAKLGRLPVALALGMCVCAVLAALAVRP